MASDQMLDMDRKMRVLDQYSLFLADVAIVSLDRVQRAAGGFARIRLSEDLCWQPESEDRGQTDDKTSASNMATASFFHRLQYVEIS